MEFLVIGAQKAGTTTLWNLLRDHPQLWFPDAKEAPFFSHTEVYEAGWASYLERLRVPAGEGVLRGTITPHYMQGRRDASTRVVAERIAGLLPQVRILALLRDPVERARSQHAMASARGLEQREAQLALSESLRPQALRRARLRPGDTNTYVVQGEYGRILEEYLSFFPRPALHIELSDSLSTDPLGVVRRVLAYLGADAGYEPPNPLQRSFPGGSQPRVGDEDVTRLLQRIDAIRGEDRAPAQLAAARAWAAEHTVDGRGREELEQIVGRYLSAPPERSRGERVGLEFTLRKIWNVRPSPPQPIPEELRSRLAEHFAADAAMLSAVTGLRVPWRVPG
jgi:sulfotransferase family protein